MSYELEQLADEFEKEAEAAIAKVRSAASRFALAAARLQMARTKQIAEPVTIEETLRVLKALTELQAEVRKCEKDRVEELLDDLDRRARERDEVREEFFAITPREGRGLQ